MVVEFFEVVVEFSEAVVDGCRWCNDRFYGGVTIWF